MMQQFRPLAEALEARRLLSADLVGSFKGKIPASVSLKSPTKVTLHVLNSGTTAVNSSAMLYVFASLDGTLDTADPLLASSKVKLNLKPGKSTDVTETFSAPFAVDSGSYNLIGDVNGAPLVETSITNNIFISPSKTTITKPTVDLVGTVSVSPKTTSYTVGGKSQKALALTVNVANHGNTPATGPMFVNIFGSTNTTLDALDPFLTKIPTKKITLNPNKSMKFTLNFKPTASTPSGTFYGIADVNAGTTFQTAIAESNINNDTAITPNTFTINNAAIPFKAKLVGTVAADLSAVVVGVPEQVTFSAVVANSAAGTAVELDEVDASGNLIGKLTDLADNGLPGSGDAVAGDGTFSGTVAIAFDTTGTRYFVAKLADPSTPTTTAVLSIPGINAPTSQQLDQDKADASNVTAGAVAIATANGSATQIIASVQAALRSDPNIVAGSVTTSDSSVMWKSADGILNYVDTDELLGDRGASIPTQTLGTPAIAAAKVSSVASQAQASIAAVTLRPADATSNGQTAVVLDPFTFKSDSGDFADEAPTVAKMLSDAGYQTTYTAGSAVNSLSMWQGLGSNAAVVIVTHGFTDDEHGSFLGSGVNDGQDPLTNHTADLAIGRMAMGSRFDSPDSARTVAEYALNSSFFKAYTGNMDGTIVYLGACHQGDNKNMPGTFLDLGAAAVIAFTGGVPSTWAAPRGVAAFTTLLKPDKNTVGDIPGINTDQNIEEEQTPVTEPTPGSNLVRPHLSPDGLAISGGKTPPPTTPTPPKTPTKTTYTVLNEFLAFGDLKAQLPGKPLLTNVNLVVTYSWPNDEEDLDSRTTFAGGTAGFNLPGGTYIKWGGDAQDAGSQETTIVDLYDAWAAKLFDKTTTVGVGADWYEPDKGTGPATISIALEDIRPEMHNKQYQIQTLVITPATEIDGATSQQGVITVTLSGDPAKPSVAIKLTKAS